LTAPATSLSPTPRKSQLRQQSVKSAAYTAAGVSELVLADASSAAFTVTLPNTVTVGSRIIVKES
jgi:hypothetical protein